MASITGWAKRLGLSCAFQRRAAIVTALGLLIGISSGAGAAYAHVTGVSRSEVEVLGATVRYELTVNPVDLGVALGLIADADEPLTAEMLADRAEGALAYAAERLLVFADGAWCGAEPQGLETGAFPEYVGLKLIFHCPKPPKRLLLQYLVFSEVDPHHATVGQVQAGTLTRDFTLNFEHPELDLHLEDADLGVAGQAWRFFLFGIEHILIGHDHILFLLAVILASLRWRYLVTVISMFTVAHTVTLLLAAFGWVRLPGALVESVIALSIAWVALENLTGWGLRRRWAVTFGFGLVHGLGFASVLAGLAGGGRAHVAALLTFNLGVEAGQLAILAVVLPVLLLLGRLGWHRPLMLAGSGGILLMALYWFGERALWG